MKVTTKSPFFAQKVLCALVSVVCLLGILRVPAVRADQATQPLGPVLTLTIPPVVHQSDKTVKLGFDFKDGDNSGLKYFTFTGANRTLINTFTADVHEVSGALSWSVANYPLGVYTFVARGVDQSGKEVDEEINVTLVP